jgi:hypothetical protein
MNRDTVRRGVMADRSANARLEVMIGEVLLFGTIASLTLLAVGLVMTATGYRIEIRAPPARCRADHSHRNARGPQWSYR